MAFNVLLNTALKLRLHKGAEARRRRSQSAAPTETAKRGLDPLGK